LSLPFLARSALLALALVLALRGIRDLGFHARPVRLDALRAELAGVAKAGLRYGWSERSLRLLMLASAVQTSFLTWGFYAWQPYFREMLRTDAVWFAGAIAAAVACSTMLGNALVEYFGRLCGRRTTLVLWAAGIQTLAAIGIGLAPSFPLALASLLTATATIGVVGPVRQAYIHEKVRGEQRATVVSFDSMVANLGGVGGQAGLGYLAKVDGYAAGYLAGGAVTALALPLFLGVRRLREGADRIVGKAGKESPCAAQGLASAGAVDDKAYTDHT
jgi:MFS family permease